MKSMKKLLAIALVLVMLTGLAVTAFAADPTGSITITGAVTDPVAETTEYDAYRIFDMTTSGAVDDDGNYTAVAYTINSAWANFFADGAPGAAYIVAENSGSLNPIVIGSATKYINITETNVAAFAFAAYQFAIANNVAPAKIVNANKGASTVEFTELPLGYYMVYPRGATIDIGSYTSIVSLTNTAPDGEIAQKAKFPGGEKVADDISVEVGQTVTYTLSSEVPNTAGYTKYEMTFTDKTTAGLTFDGADSIKVKIGTATLAATDYQVVTTDANYDFKVIINMLEQSGTSYVGKYTVGDAITVTYTATVNENAISKIDENTFVLIYNNDPNDTTSTGTTPPVVVPTYSAKIKIVKVDAKKTETKLAGAKFVLRVKALGTTTGDSHESDIAVGKYYYYDTTNKEVKWVTPASEKVEDLAKDTTITVVTTDSNGEAAFNGLENGTYELIEVEAPPGYNLVTDPKEAVVNGSDADETSLTIVSQVENNSGALLPSTGGIGTTLFYIFGSILVLAAGIVLVTKRRVRE